MHWHFIFRMIAWLLMTIVILVSISPVSSRPITGWSHSAEHLAAFSMIGLTFAIGNPGQTVASKCAQLVVFAGVAEVVQLFASGRHARVSDFLIDGVGVCAGVIIADAVRLFASKMRA